MSDAVIAPCARCGKVPEVYQDGAYSYLSCDDCYDGSEDSGTRSEVAGWYTRARTIADWNDKMEELANELADRAAGLRDGEGR